MSYTPTGYAPYDFANRRHIGPSPREMTDMLDAVCAESLDAFIDAIVPADIRQARPLAWGKALSERGVLERLRAETWLNIEDFEKAVEVARKYYPEPPRQAAKPEPRVPQLKPADLTAMPKTDGPAAPPIAAAEKFEWRIESWPAKFVRTWRIRVQR